MLGHLLKMEGCQISQSHTLSLEAEPPWQIHTFLVVSACHQPLPSTQFYTLLAAKLDCLSFYKGRAQFCKIALAAAELLAGHLAACLKVFRIGEHKTSSVWKIRAPTQSHWHQEKA